MEMPNASGTAPQLGMESSTSGPILFCALIFLMIVYWPVWFAAEALFLAVNPALYHRLNREDRVRKLIPAIMMMVRIFFGVGMTLPSCAYAAATTPWRLGEPLNTPGQVCIATQSLVWALELPMILPYSKEIFLHHIICSIVTINAVLSPTIHMIKPIYVYYASQMGDLGPGCVLLLKMAGHRPHNSRAIYGVVIASTAWLVCGKVGITVSSIGAVLESPYRITDWVWSFCLLFFGIYSTYSGYKNLKWLGLVGYDPKRPFAYLVLSRLRMPLSHVFLGLACASAFLGMAIMYAMFSVHQVTERELSVLAFHGLVAAAIGLTSATALRVIYPVKTYQTDPWGRELYLQCGLLLAGAWMAWVSGQVDRLDRPTLLRAAAVSVPLFQAMARVAHYYSAKDTATKMLPDDSDSEDDKPNPKLEAKMQKDTLVARAHLAIARANFAIFALTAMTLLTGLMDVSEAAFCALVSCVTNQLLRSPGMIIDSLWDSSVSLFLQALLTAVVTGFEFSVVAFGVGVYLLQAGSMADVVRNHGITAAVCLTAMGVERLSLRSRKRAGHPVPSSDGTPIKKPSRFRISPATFSILCTALVQAVMIREVIRNPDPTQTPDAGIGWHNFRTVLGSSVTWMGVSYMGILPAAALAILNR